MCSSGFGIPVLACQGVCPALKDNVCPPPPPPSVVVAFWRKWREWSLVYLDIYIYNFLVKHRYVNRKEGGSLLCCHKSVDGKRWK